MRPALPIVGLALLAGCASAGPVVANISYDARGALVVEKCKVHTNFFLGTMELTECATHGFAIQPQKKRATEPRSPERPEVPPPFQSDEKSD